MAILLMVSVGSDTKLNELFIGILTAELFCVSVISQIMTLSKSINYIIHHLSTQSLQIGAECQCWSVCGARSLIY